MLERSEYMPLEYFKKQKWTGSYRGMRFLFHKVTETIQDESDGESAEREQVWLEVVIWPEPFSYEKTSDVDKIYHRFSFDEEGREAAIQWLEEQYDCRQEEWKQAMKWNWDKENG